MLDTRPRLPCCAQETISNSDRTGGETGPSTGRLLLCPWRHEPKRRALYDVDMSAIPLERGIDFLEIGRDGCLRLLAAASGGVGRIAVTVSPAMIRPVNFAFDEQTQSVVFRSALGSKLREGLSSGAAAFEIDGTDPVDQTGWSVIIVGEAEEVTDPAEIDRLEDLELESWAPGVKTHWVRIRATSASGRRIVHDVNYY